jgi:alginate O-acetyltransferase complex protein AlgJ
MARHGGRKSEARAPSGENAQGGKTDAATPVGSNFFVSDFKVVEGRDGWLFLANDSNDTVGQHTGRRRFSKKELETWRKLLEARVAFLDERGIRYVFGVAPDTHAVHQELLPDDLEPVAERPIHQLMRHLEEHDSPVRIIYPLEEMRAAKHRTEVSSPVDSHWSEFGAFISYQRYLDEIEGDVPFRRLAEDDIQFVEAQIKGDLGFKLDRTGPMVIARMPPTARMLSDNCVHNIGEHVVTECDAAPPTRCLVFGDSFTNSLLRFVAEGFGRMVFAHLPNMDFELVDQERPDVVMTVMAERFMVRIPEDEGVPSLERLARYKYDLGRIRPALRFWEVQPEPVDRPLTPLEIERIRARVMREDGIQSAAFVSAIAYGGLRPREAMWLSWSAIEDSKLTVEIVPGGHGAMPPDAPKLAERAREVRLLKPLAEDLQRLREESGSPSSGYVFGNEDGSRWQPGQWQDWLETIYKPAAEAVQPANPWTNPHLLRNTFATLLIGEGVPWPEAADELDVSVTEGPRGLNLMNAEEGDPLPTVEAVEQARRQVEEGAGEIDEEDASPAGALPA